MSLIIWGCLAAAALVGPFPIRLAAGKRISSFLIEQKFSHNLVMVGSSGLGGTISKQVGCWQTNLKRSYITETHRVHGSRLLFLKGKYAKTSLDELSWKILKESMIFCAYNHLFV